jgi:hypothetical protein
MKSKVFTGYDTYDLDRQVWHWREANPEIKLLKQHPDEQLALEFKPIRRGEVIEYADMLSRRVDYEVTGN